MNHPEYRITLGHGLHDHAKGDEIVNFVEIDLLAKHLAMYRIEMLIATVADPFDAVATDFLQKQPLDLIDVARAILFVAGNLIP